LYDAAEPLSYPLTQKGIFVYKTEQNQSISMIAHLLISHLLAAPVNNVAEPAINMAEFKILVDLFEANGLESPTIARSCYSSPNASFFCKDGNLLLLTAADFKVLPESFGGLVNLQFM
jgi:hypothetical protein